MTPREQRELLNVIGGLFDRTLEQGAASQFAQQLTADVEVRRLYADLVALNVDLEWTCNTHSQRDLFAASAGITVPAETNRLTNDAHAELPKPSSFRFRFSRHEYSLFSQPVVWCVALVGLCLYGSFILVAWNLRPDKRRGVDDASGRSVAVISDATDVRWSKNASSKSAQSPVLVGEPLKIDSGVMKLELDAGTKLIVEGPADWSVDGPNSVSLRAGKILARVPQQAVGFTVQTDHAVIVDLGTEFSVEVSDAGQTHVQVTRGAVNVDARATISTSKQQQSIRLTAGQAVQVDGKGVAARSGSFSPAMAPQRADQKSSREGFASLDLVDIVAGGDGRGHARDRGINACDGRILYVPDKEYGSFAQVSSTGYRHVEDRPLIDGVNIPNPSKGAVQLTSAGHTFDGFPKTNGETWGPIWAAGSVPTPRHIFRTTFDGKLDYGVAPHGAIALHANKLITFDLEAIRRFHPKQRLVRFCSVVGLTKPADMQDEPGLADSWVFIDGQVRHNRLAINSSHGPQTVELPLDSSNRFLTLVATDAGNSAHFDWILFGDPRLELEANTP